MQNPTTINERGFSMANSIKVTKAYNEKTRLKNIEVLRDHEKEQLLSILVLMLNKDTGFKPRLTITRNRRDVYVGHSINTALSIYLQLLEQSIKRLELGLTLEFSFYATNKNDSITLLGGSQS
jgi:hypothetical protein